MDMMHPNLINKNNNKLYSDILGHMGSGVAGLSGSPPQQRRECEMDETPKHGRRFLLSK